MPVLYITSDHPGSGRTAFSAGIASALNQNGTSAFVIKPLYLQGGHDPSMDPDVADYHLLGLGLTEEPLPVTPHDLEDGLAQQFQAPVEQALQSSSQSQGVTIVEGLPGLDINSGVARASQDMATLFDAKVIVVIAFTPALTAAYLTNAQDLFKERLLGVVINGVTRHQFHQTYTTLIPSIEAQGIRVLGAIPEDRRLLGVRVRDIAQGLQGEILLGEEKADDLVEHFMVGANVLDESTPYFEQRTNKAVLVRGDRPDIQMGALATATTCLVLTGGKGPIQYVEYEAQQTEIPLVRVPQPTLEAAQIMNSLLEQARFNHHRKLERFHELLLQHLDWELFQRELRS